MFLAYIVVICVAVCVTETTKEELQDWLDMDIMKSDSESDQKDKEAKREDSTVKTDTLEDKKRRRKVTKTRHVTLISLRRRYRKQCVKHKDTEKCKQLRTDISDIKKKNDKKRRTRRPNNQKSVPIEITKRKDPSLKTKVKHSSFREKTFSDRCNNETKSSPYCMKLLERIMEKTIAKHAVGLPSLPTTREIGDIFLCSLNQAPFSLSWYNPETHICCDGLYQRNSYTQQCCRGSIINTETHFCCGLDENSQIYSRDKNTHSDCCGTFVYNSSTEMCCNAKLHHTFADASCCDIHIYNRSTHLCCDERTVNDRASGDTCCGADVYYTESQMCCEGVLQQAYGEKNGRGRCCGNTSYDSSCYSCKDGSASEPRFNITEQLCCNGQVEPKIDNNSLCCGDTVYSATENTCVDGSVVHLQTTTDHYDKSVYSTFAIVIKTDTVEKKAVETDTNENGKILILSVAGLAAILVTASVVVIGVVRCKRRYHHSKGWSPEKCKIPIAPNLQSGPRLSFHSKTSLNVYLTLPMNNVTTASIHSEDSASDDDDSERISFLSAADRNQTYNGAHNDTCHVHYKNKNSLDYFEKKWENSKPNNLHVGNLLTDHFSDRSTQTGPPKQCNRRTIFGSPFAHSYILDGSNSSIRMPESDVTMCLPITFLTHNRVETHCSSFDDLPALRRKLYIPNDQSLASPVVEYALTGYTDLPDYARVTLPFVGDPDQLTVWKFVSDEGLSTTAVSVKVPLNDKMNTDIAVYCVIEGCNVVVYTKSFSGFYCTTCKHTRELKLRMFLFGSYKRFRPARHEIRLMLYIADELLKYEDYRKRMNGIEENEGRTLKVQQMLLLPKELREEDFLQASVTLAENHETAWMHKLHPKTKRPIKPEEPSIALREIVQKCPECPNCHLQTREIPYCVEWYLTSKPNVQPEYTFQCVVDVQCFTVRVPEVLQMQIEDNSLIVDELTLRPEDRIPFEESADSQRIRDIKEKIVSWQYEKKVDVIQGLCSKHDVRGESVHEVFNRLQQKMTPRGIYEGVIAVLTSKRMFGELDDLQKILPDNYFPKPTQRVSEENNESMSTTYTHRIVRHEHANQENATNRTSYRHNNVKSDTEYGATAGLVNLENINTGGKNNQQGVQQDHLEVIYCRRERDESTPLTSFTKRNTGHAEAAPKPEFGNVRRELNATMDTSHALNVIEVIPIQENASMDETFAKDLNDDFEDNEL